MLGEQSKLSFNRLNHGDFASPIQASEVICEEAESGPCICLVGRSG